MIRMIPRWKTAACQGYQVLSLPAIRGPRWSSSLPRKETITVPCQSNGTINLDVYYPLKRVSNDTHSLSVLLHLPRGPYLHNSAHDASTLAILHSRLQCPIVSINYRLDRENPYPTPFHDALCGYDWVVENLLPKRAIARAGRSEHVGRLSVCGELIGGALATMLALTECRIGEPGVVAAAVNNPLVDWVSLDQPIHEPLRAKRISKHVQEMLPVDMEPLLAARSLLFRRPADYFDPFASPILFFRSAGVAVPTAPPPMPGDDMDHLSRLEGERFASDEVLDADASAPIRQSEDLAEDSKPTMRRVSKRFPSKILGLSLPSFFVSAGADSPLLAQTHEFETLFRKSVIREHSRESTEFGRKVLLEEEEDDSVNDILRPGSDKVQSIQSKGIGLWDDTHDGRDRVMAMAEWLELNSRNGAA